MLSNRKQKTALVIKREYGGEVGDRLRQDQIINYDPSLPQCDLILTNRYSDILNDKSVKSVIVICLENANWRQ